jgi:hypothetical protein
MLTTPRDVQNPLRPPAVTPEAGGPTPTNTRDPLPNAPRP